MTDLELARKHRYRLPDGRIAVSVTRVLSILDHEDKSAKMAGAAARLTREGHNYRKVWAEKRDRGTRIHDHCEQWLYGESVDAAPDDMPYLDGLEAFFIAKNPKPLEIERVVLSHLGWGGRFDFIAEFDGLNTLVDLKTGRPYALEHCCQLAAYRYSDGMAAYGDDDNLSKLDPLPPIDRAGCLYLDPEYKDGYLFVEYPAEARALSVFQHLLDVYNGIDHLKEELSA